MIKIEVTLKERPAMDVRDEVINWCIANIGPSIPRGQHNQKRKKMWAVKFSVHRGIQLMIRSPVDATMAMLRWGNK